MFPTGEHIQAHSNHATDCYFSSKGDKPTSDDKKDDNDNDDNDDDKNSDSKEKKALQDKLSGILSRRNNSATLDATSLHYFMLLSSNCAARCQRA